MDDPNTTLSKEAFDDAFASARPMLRVVAGAECGFAFADDAVQQGAVTAWTKRDDFTPGTSFNAWSAAIVRGAARNMRRSERRHDTRRAQAARSLQRQGTSTASHTPNTGISPGSADRPSVYLPEDLDPVLVGALGSLSPDQRCCLLLRAVSEMSYSAIGALLDIPEATARSHVYRARAAMLGALQQSDQSRDGRETETREKETTP